jgi:hypothetical protein
MVQRIGRTDRLDGMVQLQPDNARYLCVGNMLYHGTRVNADGTAMRGRITSVKTWKRTPDRVQIGYKHGLYDTGYLSAVDMPEFYVDSRTHEGITMRTAGYTGYRVRLVQPDGTYTWDSAWINGIRSVLWNGAHIFYAVLVCPSCGSNRLDRADSLNPYPYLCPCGHWYDSGIAVRTTDGRTDRDTDEVRTATATDTL